MNSEVFIIAEVGQAHDGSLGILHSYIDAVAKTGVDAIKFQTHIAEAESSEYEPFRIPFSYVDATRYDYWNRMSFTFEQWRGIKAHCDDVGLEFISSPFSVAAVELLEEVGVSRYKIGSGEVTNKLMLDVIAKTQKEVILSSGLSSYVELDAMYKNLVEQGVQPSVLQCTTKYPTQMEDVGLNVIPELMSRYPNANIGLSDHSGTVFPSLSAVTLGASIIEVHVVFDKLMFGPDSSSSLTLSELQFLVDGVRNTSTMLANPIDKNNSGDKALKGIFEKSLSVNVDLKRGHVISIGDLESKKPSGKGLPASKYTELLGRTLNKDLNQWDFITEGDICE